MSRVCDVHVPADDHDHRWAHLLPDVLLYVFSFLAHVELIRAQPFGERLTQEDIDMPVRVVDGRVSYASQLNYTAHGCGDLTRARVVNKHWMHTSHRRLHDTFLSANRMYMCPFAVFRENTYRQLHPILLQRRDFELDPPPRPDSKLGMMLQYGFQPWRAALAMSVQHHDRMPWRTRKRLRAIIDGWDAFTKLAVAMSNGRLTCHRDWQDRGVTLRARGLTSSPKTRFHVGGMISLPFGTAVCRGVCVAPPPCVRGSARCAGPTS